MVEDVVRSKLPSEDGFDPKTDVSLMNTYPRVNINDSLLANNQDIGQVS